MINTIENTSSITSSPLLKNGTDYSKFTWAKCPIDSELLYYYRDKNKEHETHYYQKRIYTPIEFLVNDQKEAIDIYIERCGDYEGKYARCFFANEKGKRWIAVFNNKNIDVGCEVPNGIDKFMERYTYDNGEWAVQNMDENGYVNFIEYIFMDRLGFEFIRNGQKYKV